MKCLIFLPSLLLLSGVASAQLAPVTTVTTAPPAAYLGIPPIPNGPDLDPAGEYIARLRNYTNQTALLDITVTASGYDVAATVSSRALKQTFRASGTRSVFKASPVTVNLVSQSGQGSVCEGGFTETYQVEVTFVRASEATGEGGRGRIQRFVCDPLARQYRPDPLSSGELEVARK